MEGKVMADGNLIGRLGAAAALIAAGVLLSRVCGLGGKVCVFGGDCAEMTQPAQKR